MFAYADDLAVIDWKRNRAMKAIEIVETWTKNNKMMINKKKSGIMFFRKKKRNKNRDNEKEIAGYPIVEDYKYLGI